MDFSNSTSSQPLPASERAAEAEAEWNPAGSDALEDDSDFGDSASAVSMTPDQLQSLRTPSEPPPGSQRQRPKVPNPRQRVRPTAPIPVHTGDEGEKTDFDQKEATELDILAGGEVARPLGLLRPAETTPEATPTPLTKSLEELEQAEEELIQGGALKKIKKPLGSDEDSIRQLQHDEDEEGLLGTLLNGSIAGVRMPIVVAVLAGLPLLVAFVFLFTSPSGPPVAEAEQNLQSSENAEAPQKDNPSSEDSPSDLPSETSSSNLLTPNGNKPENQANGPLEKDPEQTDSTSGNPPLGDSKANDPPWKPEDNAADEPLDGPRPAMSLEELTDYLLHSDSQFREQASDLLAKRGPAAVPALLEILEGSNEDARKLAVTTFEKLGPDAAKAVPALIELLRSGSLSLQFPTMKALAAIGPPAVPAAVELLDDRQLRVQENAGWILVKMLPRLGPHAGLAAQRLARFLPSEDSKHETILGHADQLLRAIGQPAVPHLVQVLQSRSEVGQRRAWLILTELGADSAPAAPLLAVLLGKRPSYRREIEQAITAIGAAGTPYLVRQLVGRGTPQEQRRQTAKAFRFIGAPAVPNLLSLLSSNQPAIARLYAALALGEIGPPARQAAPMLRRMISEGGTLGAHAKWAYEQVNR